MTFCDVGPCLDPAHWLVTFWEGGRAYPYCERHFMSVQHGRRRGWDPRKIHNIERTR
jgi:hypothetical protein